MESMGHLEAAMVRKRREETEGACQLVLMEVNISFYPAKLNNNGAPSLRKFAQEAAMAEAAASRFKGKQVEVEILTDTYQIRGTLFVPLAGKDGYSARLSDFLNNPENTFLALTNVCVEVLPDPDMKWDAP